MMSATPVLRTELTDRLGILYPIIQAPMAGAAGGRLAGRVSAAGGLGMIATGSTATVDAVEEEMRRARELSAAPFGVGFLTWALPDQQELWQRCLRLKPAAILLSFGDPTPYADAVLRAGITLICQVRAVKEAQQARKAGADIIVAQGTEAGGHTGHVSTLPLVPRVIDAVSPTPVVAAGGIADGRGLAAALMLGAAGVMMGTRFVATPESSAPDEHKQRLLAADESDTVLTRVFDLVQGIPWPAKYPGRALRNRFTDAWHGREGLLEQGMTAARETFDRARKEKDYEIFHTYAGEVSGLVGSLEPAGEVVRRTAAEAEQIIRRWVGRLG